jgi:hypothetical protein
MQVCRPTGMGLQMSVERHRLRSLREAQEQQSEMRRIGFFDIGCADSHRGVVGLLWVAFGYLRFGDP